MWVFIVCEMGNVMGVTDLQVISKVEYQKAVISQKPINCQKLIGRLQSTQQFAK
jgi:hypothetical protein